MRDDAPVLLIGPWPPPVHGLAVMHAHMAEAIAARAPVRRFDVSGHAPGQAAPPGAAARARHLLALAAGLRRALASDVAPRSMFVSTSAGGVMWFDAWCAAQGARRGVPVHVHHHSWACLDDGGVPWHRRGAFARLQPHRHWVLCDHMRDRLVARHAVAPGAVGVLSNAAFFGPRPGAPERPLQSAPLTLGFFSNVTASKGIDAFLDVVERLQSTGRTVAARVAGPLDAGIAGPVRARLASLRDARHVGALDGEAAKAGFFAGIHRLVLPSRHVHEAEPLVVIESLAHGVPVIATDRGCLPSAWAHPDAVTLFTADGFVDGAAATLEAAQDRGIDAAREAAVARAWLATRHGEARRGLDDALDDITRLRIGPR